MPTVAQRVFQLNLADIAQNFQQGGCRAARGVLLEPVMGLDHFEIERSPENFGSLSSEPEEGVHPGRVVRGPDHGNLSRSRPDGRLLRLAMTCGADDQGFSVGRTQGSHLSSGVMVREVDHRIGLWKDRRQIIADIQPGNDLQLRMILGTRQQCLTHPPLGTRDDDARHEWNPTAMSPGEQESRCSPFFTQRAQMNGSLLPVAKNRVLVFSVPTSWQYPEPR